MALILPLSGCPSESSERTSAAGSSGSGGVDEPACSDAECLALAGVCQEAHCDARSGGCRVGAAHEGEPCLEGNPCGASECRSGECVPLAPPACAELSDACRLGACHPGAGCVAEPRAIPGTLEDNAVRLLPRGVGRSTASSACQEQPSIPTTCTEGLTGPSAIFELDLSDATELTRAHLIMDAGFAFEAALTRGPSADPAVLHCAEPYYADGKSRDISAELEPGRYHLVVTGRSEADRGLIYVASVVADPELPGPPANDDCATALVIDGSIAQQTIVPSTLGATAQTTSRCAPVGAVDVFYELDLSGHSSEVMLDVDVEGGGESASLFAPGSDACTEALTCGEWWSHRVTPGVYKLALHFTPRDVFEEINVRVRVGEGTCPSPINDRTETAFELDPTLATQRIQGNTACGNDDSTVCSEDRGAPDLFYRLDLRNHGVPQRIQLQGEYVSGLRNYVLVASDDTDSLRPTRCDDAQGWFYLAPRLYYLVIDGLAQKAGRFDLELTVTDAFAEPRDCPWAQDTFTYCLADSEPACAVSSAHPDCIRTAAECGLTSDVYVTFCTAHPGCCDGTEPTASCEGPWREAAIICPP